MQHPITRCLALIGLFLVLGACSRGPGSIVNGKVAVTVDKVNVEEKKPALSLAAVIEPSAKTTIKFPFDIKIDKVNVRLGAVVNPGDILFELNQADLSIKLAILKSKRGEKKALLDKNQYFFENRDRLLAEGKIDQPQYDTIEMEVNKAKAEFDHLDADALGLESQLGQSQVKAPFDGVVTEISVAGGATVSANENCLTLVKIDPAFVSFQVSPTEAAGLTLGTSINVKVEGVEDKNFPAMITFINPELDPANHMVNVKASLPNNGTVFRGGQQAQVNFIGQRAVKVLSLPAHALLQENEKEFVYVVRDGKAWPVRVYTRKSLDNPETVEIQEGVSIGDIIVTEGQDKLKAGAEVNLWR